MELRYTVLEEVGSTNTMLKELSTTGEAAGYVLAAHRQTAGRGRQGRTFHSPGGLYMSVLLRPNLADITKITPAAAVAVCRAVKAVCGVSPKIKWVNDIYIDGKKVSGILTELVGDAVIVGIGINISPPKDGWHDDIKARAGSLFDEPREDIFDPLMRAVAEELVELCDMDSSDILKLYAPLEILTGNKVKYEFGEQCGEGVAEGIADDFSLIVRTDDGRINLTAGEAHILT